MNCTALCMCAGLLSVASLQAGTQQIEAPQEGPVISFHLENDMFVGDDDNYTNGVRFAWMSGTTSRSHTFSGMPVSYTHLTLPTIYSVEISVVAGSLKKKKTRKQGG